MGDVMDSTLMHINKGRQGKTPKGVKFAEALLLTKI